MEKENKKIIYEAVLVNEAFYSEIAEYGDDEYFIYHQQSANLYRDFSDRINRIVGFTGKTMDEFTSYVSAISLTSEQKRALFELRRKPMFKKLMGETALQQKSELEKVLGSTISAEGMTFADEQGAKVAIKSLSQLNQELNTYSDKIADLLNAGDITEEQYNNYSQNLEYIYTYYISKSKGEQIPFRKMSNTQYEQIEEQALENGISFDEQVQNFKEDFEEIQVVQKEVEQSMKR